MEAHVLAVSRRSTDMTPTDDFPQTHESVTWLLRNSAKPNYKIDLAYLGDGLEYTLPVFECLTTSAQFWVNLPRVSGAYWSDSKL